MRLSIWFLVAAFVAGDAGATVAYAQQAPAPAVPAGPSGYTYVQGGYVPQGGYVQQGDPGSGPLGLGLGRRLSGLFRRQPQAAPTMVRPQTPTVQQSAEPPIAEPVPQRAPAPVARPVAPVVAPATTPTAQEEQEPSADGIKKEHVVRVAMADDATWVIGELHYVHADGGLWVLRYAPLDKEDRYGGAVVLAKGIDMSKFEEGDLVFVKGSIVDEGRASKYVGGPLYRATSIDLNERPGDK